MGRYAKNHSIIWTANADQQASYANLLKRYPGNDVRTQAERLLHALTLAPVTTFDAHKYLDVYYAPARVKELRRRGFEIDTLRVAQLTDAGVVHNRVGMYVLRRAAS